MNQSKASIENFPRIFDFAGRIVLSVAMITFNVGLGFDKYLKNMTLLTSIFQRQLVPSPLKRGECEIDG